MSNRAFFFEGITDALRAQKLSFESEERHDHPDDPSLVIKVSGFEVYVYSSEVLLCWYDGDAIHKRDCINFEAWEYKTKERQLSDVLANLAVALENKAKFIAATYEEPKGFAGFIKQMIESLTLGRIQLKIRRKPGTKS